MKRFWQLSTSLLLISMLAGHASAQGYGPRSWKVHAPAPKAETEVLAEAPAEADDPPAPLDAKKTTKTDAKSEAKSDAKPDGKAVAPAVATGDKKDATAPAYYAQSEAPPPAPQLLSESPAVQVAGTPSCDTTCTNKVGCSEPLGCAAGVDPGCDLQSGCGDVADNCPTRNFARIEYLMWWGRGRALPPLVTTSFNGTPQAQAGVLGQPNTSILYGGNDIGTDIRSGARLTVGRVLDPDGVWMAVGRFYGLGDSSDSFHATSAAGDPILARPFFNTLLQQEDAFLVAFPGVSTNGVIDVRSRTEMLGADALIRHLWYGEEDMTIDVLAGYQFSRLNDSLDIRSSELIVNDPRGIFPANTTVALRDTFRTRNEFHGAAFGLAIDTFRGPWKFEALGKFGFGNQRQTVIIDGNTVITPLAGAPTVTPQGLLARATNNGTYTRDTFTFIPEANFTLGYQKDNWMFTVGYSFMYWKDVAWAGDQVDTRVNLSNPLVGAPQPNFFFQNTDFWLQGVNFGVEYSF